MTHYLATSQSPNIIVSCEPELSNLSQLWALKSQLFRQNSTGTAPGGHSLGKGSIHCADAWLHECTIRCDGILISVTEFFQSNRIHSAFLVYFLNFHALAHGASDASDARENVSTAVDKENVIQSLQLFQVIQR